MNAGVGIALEKIIKQHRNIEHHVLWSSRNDGTMNIIPTSTESVRNYDWDGSVFTKIRTLLRIVKEVEPQYIHAHSTRAGLISRLVLPRNSLLFSPHCFSFQRQDISKVEKILLFIMEFFLGLKNEFLIANWPIELKYGKHMPYRKNVIFYPLIEFAQTESLTRGKHAGPHVILSIGRISTQKDPEFFSQIAAKFKKDQNWKFIWVGAGDLKFTDKLINSGVEVIPWVNANDVHHYYSKACLTLITSKWESGPFTLFESLNNGTPVVCRDIPALRAYNLDCFNSITDFVVEIENHACGAEKTNLLNSQRKSTSLAFNSLGITQNLYER